MRKTLEEVMMPGVPNIALDPAHVQLQALPGEREAPPHRWTSPPQAQKIIDRMPDRAIVRPPLPPLGGDSNG